ncbi:MAG: hypothetical protein QOK37_4505 [Thermoanaerobaculia bacterium]|jgi:hypothetical protein|nr:hypothetical protein [Thermoanaerobaculia bacterium]
MDTAVDFVIESPQANEMLLVEAKSIDSPSDEWAARFARNILGNTRPQANQFLLLVLRNYLYLWKHDPREGSDLPDFSGPTEEALKPYLKGVQTPLHEITGPSFELLVRVWLTDISEGIAPPSVATWMRSAGLEQFENGLLREAQRN